MILYVQLYNSVILLLLVIVILAAVIFQPIWQLTSYLQVCSKLPLFIMFHLLLEYLLHQSYGAMCLMRNNNNKKKCHPNRPIEYYILSNLVSYLLGDFHYIIS